MRDATLGQRAASELVGTAFLVTAVIGSGIAASRLSPGDVGLQLLENSLITGAALVALILALQPVSAAFNPVVTLVERAFGVLSTRTALALMAAQFAGGILGAIVANLMFGLPAVSIATHQRSGAGLWLGEVVATLGLVVVIFGALRAGRASSVAFAVGGYITAAYWFTSSTSFANPAVTLARMFSDTFAGIAPGSVPPFVVMQLIGGGLACLVVRVLYPNAPTVAADPVPVKRGSIVSDTATRPAVLYACIHNSGRSVAAQVLTEHYAGGAVAVRSAGSEPGDTVNPVVAQVLAERGLFTAGHKPTLLDGDLVEAADVVITMGCGETCPVFPGRRYEDWPVADPKDQDLPTVRAIVDDIDQRVRKLLGDLQVPVKD
jgi:arsenate reductase (thioredoxin)